MLVPPEAPVGGRASASRCLSQVGEDDSARRVALTSASRDRASTLAPAFAASSPASLSLARRESRRLLCGERGVGEAGAGDGGDAAGLLASRSTSPSALMVKLDPLRLGLPETGGVTVMMGEGGGEGVLLAVA